MDEVLNYRNYNIHEIMTPINPDKLEQLLQETGYDKDKTAYLIDGFRNGFSLGYEGPQDRHDEVNNIPLKIRNRVMLWNKVMKEVKLGRYAGPFKRLPFKSYIQFPIGLVPKDKGKQTRLIFHLSFDFGEEHDKKSVNFFIPDNKCTVKYRDLDHAVRVSLKIMDNFGDSCTIFYSKTDLMSTFRVVPLKVSQYWMLCMYAYHPVTNKKLYFCDKMLPFGAGSSCAIYQSFSNCLQHIVEHQIGQNWTCTNYLDDFCFQSESEEDLCNWMVRQFLQLCKDINCPVSDDKTEWADSKMVFLGILLNGESKTLAVPEEKRIKAVKLLQWIISKRNITILMIQRLTGILNFLGKAIVPGRTFTRRMYDKLTWCDHKGNKLKQHHHIQLDKKFLDDCEVWLQFLQNPQSKKICRPYLDLNETVTAKTLNFYSDSSGRVGMGAIFDNHWIVAEWNKSFLEICRPSIQFLELYALVAAILTWGERLRNMRIQVFVDNKGARDVVNNSSSNCKRCLNLLRLLMADNLAFNRRVFVLYVESK